MKRFLVDANLPFRIPIWQSEAFLFVAEINDEMSDSQIWDYAKKNNFTIITKDSDFSNRIIVSIPPPKVIHIRVGNLRLRDFARFIDANWKAIRNASASHKLVNVYLDRIETIK